MQRPDLGQPTPSRPCPRHPSAARTRVTNPNELSLLPAGGCATGWTQGRRGHHGEDVRERCPVQVSPPSTRSSPAEKKPTMCLTLCHAVAVLDHQDGRAPASGAPARHHIGHLGPGDWWFPGSDPLPHTVTPGRTSALTTVKGSTDSIEPVFPEGAVAPGV